MISFAFVVAVAVAFYATRLSTRQAEEFILGKTSDQNVVPGSGRFFDGLAPTYDILNSVISLGFHHQWRRIALSHILPSESVLDVSTGTADLAISLATNRTMRVVGVDPSVEMLAVGRSKIAAAGDQLGDIQLVEGVAEELPFPDASFHSVVIAFGVRNFQNRQKGLDEIARVLKPGGKLVVLEVTLPKENTPLNALTRFFVKNLIPVVAGFVSGNVPAYRYLGSSMDDFPVTEAFVDMLATAGLTTNHHEHLPPLAKGPELFVASKPPDSTSQ